jgi:hypothetical protein
MADNKPMLPSSGVATSQQTQQSPQPKRKGTGFTNLARILQASQGSKLGQAVAGGITGQAQQVQSGVRSAQEQFRKEAQTEADKLDKEKREEIIEQAASGKDITSALPQFQTFLSGEYKGPMQLANQQQLAAQAQQAENLGRLASGVGGRSGTDQGGRQELLRRFAGGADYTSGQRKLDESILARDKEANLAAAARQTRGVAEEAQRAGLTAQAEAQQYKNLAKIFAKETAEEIGKAKDPISAQLNTQVQAIKDKEDAKRIFYDNLNKEIAISDTLKESPELKKQRLNSLLSAAKESGYISEQDLADLTTPVDMTKTAPYIQTQGKINSLTSEIDDIWKRLYQSNQGWYGTERQKEAQRLEKRRNDLIQQREDEIANLSALKVPISSNLLDRAIQSGIDLNQLTKDSSLFSPSLNLTRAGIADEQTISKLNALDKLLQKQGTDLEFLPGAEKYKEGEFNIKSRPAQKQILQKELEKTLADLEKAEKVKKDLRVMDITSRYSRDVRSLDKKREKLLSAIKDIETQENIEAAEKIK